MQEQVVIDCEMTGLDITMNHRVVSIGALFLSKNGKVKEEYYQEIRPVGKCVYDDEAADIHGMNVNDIMSNYPSTEVIKEFHKKIKPNSTIIGWCVQKDLEMLNNEFNLLGLVSPFSYRIYDLHSVFINNYGKSLPLEDVSDILHIKLKRGKQHNALEDAQIAYEIYRKLSKVPMY